MRVAIVGSREYPNREDVDKAVLYDLTEYPYTLEDITVVSGGARGVDTWAEEEARRLGFKVLIFPADWDRHGKAAGMIRNREIVNNCDRVIAFWDGASRGTRATINMALDAGKSVDVRVRRP